MSWLHCMWGIGASTGPAVMAACLMRGTWHLGFLVIGLMQFVIVGAYRAKPEALGKGREILAGDRAATGDDLTA